MLLELYLRYHNFDKLLKSPKLPYFVILAKARIQ